MKQVNFYRKNRQTTVIRFISLMIIVSVWIGQLPVLANTTPTSNRNAPLYNPDPSNNNDAPELEPPDDDAVADAQDSVKVGLAYVSQLLDALDKFLPECPLTPADEARFMMAVRETEKKADMWINRDVTQIAELKEMMEETPWYGKGWRYWQNYVIEDNTFEAQIGFMKQAIATAQWTKQSLGLAKKTLKKDPEMALKILNGARNVMEMSTLDKHFNVAGKAVYHENLYFDTVTMRYAVDDDSRDTAFVFTAQMGAAILTAVGGLGVNAVKSVAVRSAAVRAAFNLGAASGSRMGQQAANMGVRAALRQASIEAGFAAIIEAEISAAIQYDRWRNGRSTYKQALLAIGRDVLLASIFAAGFHFAFSMAAVKIANYGRSLLNRRRAGKFPEGTSQMQLSEGTPSQTRTQTMTVSRKPPQTVPKRRLEKRPYTKQELKELFPDIPEEVLSRWGEVWNENYYRNMIEAIYAFKDAYTAAKNRGRPLTVDEMEKILEDIHDLIIRGGPDGVTPYKDTYQGHNLVIRHKVKGVKWDNLEMEDFIPSVFTKEDDISKALTRAREAGAEPEAIKALEDINVAFIRYHKTKGLGKVPPSTNSYNKKLPRISDEQVVEGEVGGSAVYLLPRTETLNHFHPSSASMPKYIKAVTDIENELLEMKGKGSLGQVLDKIAEHVDYHINAHFFIDGNLSEAQAMIISHLDDIGLQGPKGVKDLDLLAWMLDHEAFKRRLIMDVIEANPASKNVIEADPIIKELMKISPDVSN